jgi:hypothetical protein
MIKGDDESRPKKCYCADFLGADRQEKLMNNFDLQILLNNIG